MATKGEKHSPLEQFEIVPYTYTEIGGYNISFTKGSLHLKRGETLFLNRELIFFIKLNSSFFKFFCLILLSSTIELFTSPCIRKLKIE